MTGPPVQARIRFALDEYLTVLSASAGVKALLGYSAEDFLSSRVVFRDLIHPGDCDIAEMLFSPELPNQSGAFNFRLRHADGRIRCVCGQYTREPADGNETKTIDLWLEDAKSQFAREGAPESLTVIAPVMDIVNDALYFKNRNHVFTAANGLTRKAFESVCDNVVGLTDYDLFPEAYADAFYRLDTEALAGNPVARETRAVLGKDGQQRWVDNRIYPVRDPDGEIIGLFGAGRDITQDKMFDERLRESEESLREFQRIAGLGSYITDLRRREWTSSDVLDQLFGIGKDYVRNIEGWVALVHPDEQQKMIDHFVKEVIGERRPFDKEFRIIRQTDKAVRWVHGRGRLEFNAQGQPHKIFGTIEDITERKLADAALRESEESLIESQRIAGLGSYTVDIGTGMWTSSEVLDQLFGIGKDYVRSVDGWEALVHPGDRGSMAAYFANEVIGQGESFDRVYRIVRHSDGAQRWVHGLGRLEFDAQGRPVKMHGTIKDITEVIQYQIDLRESKELLQLFIEHAPAALAMLDREMRYLAVSHRWLEIHSLVGRDVIGQSHYEIFPELDESWKEEHRRAQAGEALGADEKLLERADGSAQWIRRRIQPWKTGDGEIGGVLIFSEDITKQKENEERLRMAASVFTNAREGIVITDANGAILDVNDTFTRITGYEREEVLGKNPRILKSGLHAAEFYANMWRSLAQEGQWSGELWNRNKSGDVYAEMKTITSVRDASGKLVRYVALFSDITQVKKHAQQLEHVTHYDLLTNLPNRTLLADRLQQAMAQAKRRNQKVAVAYLDLDGFKGINDKHGRDVGDRLLTSLAFNMKCALREGDTLARIGGDEFVAVMLDLDDTESIAPVLVQLREAASEPVQVGDLGLRVAASIGVTYYPQPGEVDADSLLRQADQAMYQAKLAGGNRYHIFDPDHDHTVRGRHENVERIRGALAAGEFVLYYQPKVNMRTGEVVGAEALIRWQHPERGLLPPGMFLPVIEDQPVAIEVGEWVIESALAQMDRWREAGLEMPVSVNVGAMQLQRKDFVDRLSCLLGAHPGAKPFSLEIEVLETSALQDVVKAAQVLNACHAIGVGLALDDFGTGYSSLTYLKRLPASILKIDQSFVSDMLDDPENLNILEGILGLASAFHRQVIAEGVETVEHGLMLLQLGCELGQGYGIARPMPASDFPGWVSVWKPDPSWAKVPLVHSGNRAVQYASVAHRAWFAAFEAFALGRRHAPPSMNPRECRFRTWLESERQAGRGTSPGFMEVDEIHEAFHELAGEILTAEIQGRDAEGRGRLSALQGMCANLVEHLDTYGQE